MIDSDRRSLRFQPDEGNIAEIDPEAKDNKNNFKARIRALIVDEALEGCCLVLTHNRLLQVGDICLVKVGMLDPLISEVRWIRDLDEEIQKIGIMYLE